MGEDNSLEGKLAEIRASLETSETPSEFLSHLGNAVNQFIAPSKGEIGILVAESGTDLPEAKYFDNKFQEVFKELVAEYANRAYDDNLTKHSFYSEISGRVYESLRGSLIPAVVQTNIKTRGKYLEKIKEPLLKVVGFASYVNKLLEVTSYDDGKVTVNLDGAKPKESSTPKQGPPQYGHGERILVVDDEPMLRAVFSDMLKGTGFDVETADDGQAALERLREVHGTSNAYELIVSDVLMPKLSGPDFYEKALSEGVAEAPVLFISGNTGDKGEKAKSLSPLPLIVKPISAQEFTSAVQNGIRYAKECATD